MARNGVDIAFIGFGEAGQAFLAGLRSERPDLRAAAFDIKTLDPETAAAKRADYAAHDVVELETAEGAATAEIIFSTVTADQAGEAAKMAAMADLSGALYLDCNSCSPGSKQRSDEIIEEAGGRYVDMAVMAPVHPKLHKTPCSVSGPYADLASQALGTLGMDITVVEGPVGLASTRKMIRSVMMKGLEALVLECVLAARKAGVEDAVLSSLDATYPGFDWPARSAYMLERVTTHGRRRAAEMREVAKTLEELGFDPRMTRAAIEWQQGVGDLGLPANDDNHKTRADAILRALGHLD